MVFSNFEYQYLGSTLHVRYVWRLVLTCDPYLYLVQYKYTSQRSPYTGWLPVQILNTSTARYVHTNGTWYSLAIPTRYLPPVPAGTVHRPAIPNTLASQPKNEPADFNVLSWGPKEHSTGAAVLTQRTSSSVVSFLPGPVWYGTCCTWCQVL